MSDGVVSVTICMGSSCFARGNADHLEFIENYIKKNNASIKLDVCGARCENKCAGGPHIKINGKIYDEVTPEMLQVLLDKAVK